MNFSSVVGYHMNPLGCGVAKFNAELAKRLGVPFVNSVQAGGFHPLLSLKWSEVDDLSRGFFQSGCMDVLPHSVFWHDAGDDLITKTAVHVFYADPSLGSPGLFCPSLITPRPRPVRLFSFGMAGRLQPDKYQRVRELLDAASIRYHLRVSVGLHEGTSLDGAEKHFDALKDIMGEENVTILGILSDDAVSEELSNAEYVLAFFERGLRLNNTTVHAALAAGKRVVTNGAQESPLRFRVWDVDEITAWPGVYRDFNWDNLIEAMRKECERSKSTAAR